MPKGYSLFLNSPFTDSMSASQLGAGVAALLDWSIPITHCHGSCLTLLAPRPFNMDHCCSSSRISPIRRQRQRTFQRALVLVLLWALITFSALRGLHYMSWSLSFPVSAFPSLQGEGRPSDLISTPTIVPPGLEAGHRPSSFERQISSCLNMCIPSNTTVWPIHSRTIT